MHNRVYFQLSGIIERYQLDGSVPLTPLFLLWNAQRRVWGCYMDQDGKVSGGKQYTNNQVRRRFASKYWGLIKTKGHIPCEICNPIVDLLKRNQY